MAPPPTTQEQLVLDIGVQVQAERNGIEMGVLENGIPFLTQNGLAKISGAARSVIYDIAQEWAEHFDDEVLSKNRYSWLRQYLAERGYNESRLYIETKRAGQIHFAYPDIVCMAVIEYYAFEAQNKNPTALENYRKLAAYGLQRFIYDALNYVPPDKWKYFADRVSILTDSAPDGYFIIFHEVSGLISDLIAAGLPVNDKTIPDISVGKTWGQHWTANNLDTQYGARIKYEHYYPSYYPQAQSNPQEPWAYPDDALPAFRHWFRHEYLPTKYPKYILTKAQYVGGQQKAKEIASLYNMKAQYVGGQQKAKEIASLDNQETPMVLRAPPGNPTDRSINKPLGERRFRLERELNEYAALEPGWDGPGSVAPASAAIREAVAFVRCLPPSSLAPEPMVAADGEVGLFWRCGGAFIDVGFRGKGTLSYYAETKRDHRPIHGDAPFANRVIPEDLLSAIECLAHPA